MHYPIMNEFQLAQRWNISSKTLHRWRRKKIGPTWHKLFRHVRYHNEDVHEFERRSAQHWMSMFGRDEHVPIVLTSELEKDTGDGADFDIKTNEDERYVSSKEVAVLTGLPLYILQDRLFRNAWRIPYLSLGGVIRFSIEEILRWEIANSVPISTKRSGAEVNKRQVIVSGEIQIKAPEKVPRWYEISSD